MAVTWDKEGYLPLRGDSDAEFEGRIHWKSRTVSTVSRESEVYYEIQLKLKDSVVSSGVTSKEFPLYYVVVPIVFGDYYEFYSGYGTYQHTYYKYLDAVSNSQEQTYTSITSTWTTPYQKMSGTCRVKHRADGWGTAIISTRITYWFIKDGEYAWGGNYPELTHNFYGAENDIDNGIPLASMPVKATITEATDFNSGTNPTLYYNVAGLGEDFVKVQAGIFSRDDSKVYAAYRDISIYEGVYTFELTEAEYEKLVADAGENPLQVRFYTRTVYDYPEDFVYAHTPTTSTFYSAKTKTFTPIDKNPVISFISAVDRNPVTLALTGNPNTLVKYHSNAFVSAQIDTYNNIDYTVTIHDYMTFPIPTVNGEIIGIVEPGFELLVTDAEGRWSVKGYHTPEEFWVEYFKPTCILQKAEIELVEETKARISIKVSGTVFRGKFGGDANAKENDIKLQVRFKADNGDWSEWAAEQVFLPEFDGNNYEASVNMSELAYDKSYTIQCRVADSLETGETVEYALKLIPVFDWGENEFRFNVPVSFQGNQMMDFIIEQGTDAMGSNGTWYWSKWKNGRAECYGIRNYGNMGISEAFGTLYASADFNQDLPYGLFAAAPEYISIVPMSGGFGTWVNKGGGDAPTATTTGTFELVRPNTKNLSQVNIGFHVIGRWK